MTQFDDETKEGAEGAIPEAAPAEGGEQATEGGENA